MELSRVVLIGSIDRVISSKGSQGEKPLFAEVVLIHKTIHPDLRPTLFQLNNDWSRLADYPHLLRKEAFIMLGEVTSIDKKSKTIFLSNDSKLSYNHLIIANSVKTDSDSFSVALESFVRALKVQKQLSIVQDVARDPAFQSFHRDGGQNGEKTCLPKIDPTISQSSDIERLLQAKISNGTMEPINVRPVSLFLGHRAGPI